MWLALLRRVSWPEWRHSRGHTLVSVLSIAMGVALAFAVHLVNESALHEFGAAVRAVNGQADFELRAQREGFDEALYARVAAHPQVGLASPVVELEVASLGPQDRRRPLKLLGVDALLLPAIAPGLMPRPEAGEDRLALVDPDAAFLNAAAAAAMGDPALLRLVAGAQVAPVAVRGRIDAAGPPMAVMDLAGVQQRFGWLGRLSRIDVRLVPGARQEAVLADLALPAAVRAVTPAQTQQQVTQVSRAYRVNLTVLALVALFTGGFLVFSALSLSVARRLPQLALLGVLGLGASERLRLVLLEAFVLGVLGSALGVALGSGLAWGALQLLSGDLGGGYFPGVAPRLRFSAAAAMVFAALGVAAALAGAALPARMAQALAPAQALKGVGIGLGQAGGGRWSRWFAPALLPLGAALAWLPPVGELPLAAYASVACLLFGGIACVPQGVGGLLRYCRPGRWPLALLAVERARHQRHVATVAVAGVVASLALSVALTVMVGSFRASVASWLDTVLPADLYVRMAGAGAGDTAHLPPPLPERAGRLPGVERVQAQRVVLVQMAADRPAVALIARPLPDPGRDLPLVEARGGARPPAAPRDGGRRETEVPVYVSEAMVSLYQAAPGTLLALPLPDGRTAPARVMGVWRDYARQSGAVVMGRDDFQRLTGDTRVNDLAVWLRPGTDAAAVQAGLRRLAGDGSGNAGGSAGALLEFASAAEIRATSLRIFDRSFTVTYWLQAVAIGMGLFGLATSVSAQVLARRKEFGLLAHLGLTRGQVLRLVCLESAVWTGAGALLGLLLGAAISAVLVHVVNPQSFHWTMDLVFPWARLALLGLAVLAAGTATAWLSGRAAAQRQAALAVKEDW